MRAPKMAAPTWLLQNGRPHNMVAAVACVGFGLCDGRWAAWPGICCIASDYWGKHSWELIQY